MARLRLKRAKELLANLALGLGGIVITLVIAEVALRVIGLNLGPALEIKADARFGWVYRPNQTLYVCSRDVRLDCVMMQVNNQSLRKDSDTTFEKAPGIRRILVLGDSQTAGVGAGETYANVLEALLDENSETYHYEVLNAGVDAYSPVQEWLWFSELGVQYQPDVTLVGFYVGNDLLDMVEIAPAPQPHFELTSQGTLILRDYPLELVESSEDGGALETLKRILRRLYLYRVVSHALKNSALAEPLRHIGVVQPVATHHSSRSLEDDRRPQAASVCRGCVLQSLSQSYYLTLLPEEEEAAFLMLEETLRRLRAEASGANTRLIILLIPTKLQVEPETDEVASSRTAETLGLTAQSAAAFDQRVYDRVIDLCRSMDIEVLDALPALATFRQQHGFSNTGENESLYLENDWHLSPAGHRALALHVYQFLSSEVD